MNVRHSDTAKQQRHDDREKTSEAIQSTGTTTIPKEQTREHIEVHNVFVSIFKRKWGEVPRCIPS